MKLNLEKLKKDWIKYETAFGEEEYMDIDSHTDMAFKVPQLIAEIEKIHADLGKYQDKYYAEDVQKAVTFILEDSEKRLSK